ncbi:MAG: hypothetical protein RMK97_02530 [Sutterellaceae bacterium]|nr:hypothetical protein [Burkholderiaceae bacterium]MCX7901909.1 hypothetical protein [Burkholderiaceae bacterium]MDW8429372.1 hypothetical protein [Sutterellaceae bacterium]
MPIFRALLVIFASAVAICVALFFLSNDRKYLTWAGRLLKVAAVAALLFFIVLALERVV